jgi:general secretion pathway protein N
MVPPTRVRLFTSNNPDTGDTRNMATPRNPATLMLLAGLVLAIVSVPVCHAATSATLDILPNDVAGSADSRVEVGPVKPLADPKREPAKPLANGNPLWSVPLSVLTTTQERPIFSASRRPPPRAVAGPRIEPVAVVPPPAAEIEHPPLELIGAVVGDRDAIAVFLDRASREIVRLRAGQSHAGWELSSILQREVTFRKADHVEVIALQRSEAPAPPAVPAFPVQPAPAAGGTSYAPFIPRSTPKNGESDGL